MYAKKEGPMDELIEISGQDYLKAVERWFEFWPTTRNGMTMETPSFYDFIETEMPPIRKGRAGDAVMQVSPQAAHRIRLLAGPYHHAVLKAYSITVKQND